MTKDELLSQLPPEDRDLYERRKSPDLTPRESLLSIEVQTRLQVLMRPVDQDARLAECAALRAEILALDFNTDSNAKINGVGQKAMTLHMAVIAPS